MTTPKIVKSNGFKGGVISELIPTNVGSTAAGAYAISTVKVMPWSKAPAAQTQSRVRKNKVAKQIAHPLFEQCVHLTKDPYWVDIFSSASFGKLPKRFLYRDGQLIHKKGAKQAKCDLPNNPHEALSVCMDFFRKHGSLISSQDQEAALELELERHKEEQNRSYSWNCFNKQMRDILVSYYVEKLCRCMNLTGEQRKELVHTINIGIILKYFGNNNIVFKGRNISQISGLLYDSETGKFAIDSAIKVKKTRTSKKNMMIRWDINDSIMPKKDQIPSCDKKWVKLLKDLVQKKEKTHRITITTTANIPDINELDLSATLTDTFDDASITITDS